MKLNIYFLFIGIIVLISILLYNTEGFTITSNNAIINGSSGSGGGGKSDPIVYIIVGTTGGVVLLGLLIKYIISNKSTSNSVNNSD